MDDSGEGQAGQAVPHAWRRILEVDEASHEYFALRSEMPGAVVFTNRGVPKFNLAIIGEVPAGEQMALLDGILAHFNAAGEAARVRLTPLSLPAGWPELLAARGFRYLDGEDEQFLALAGETGAGIAAGVAVRRLAPGGDPEDVAQVVRIQRAAFGEDSTGDDRERAIRLARASLEAGRYLYYLATVDGQPAGAATARFSGDTAGIYGVGTLPEARRRGVGTSVVAKIITDAREAGCKNAFLSAVPGSYAARLYVQMGFAPLFTVRDYELGPADERP